MLDTSKDKKNVYFITGGGTGGHIYPAVAIYDALKNDSETKEIYYVGNPENMEFKIAEQKDYKFLPIKITGMPRHIGFKIIVWFFKLQFAIFKAIFYIKKYNPDAVLGTGGYVSAPTLFACYLTNTPYMIHDCDAQPGLVSRYVAPNASVVSIAFETSKKLLKNNNIFVNGNPIREEFKTISKPQAREKLNIQNKLTLCIMGGSQGAKSINKAAIRILEPLSKKYDLQIIFQTGRKNFKEVIKKLEKVYPNSLIDKNLIIKPYFDNMTEILKASDIAISRAGSLSLSELCACGIASILIPYPYAAADHQRKNAKFLVDKHAALYLEDKDTTKDTLLIALEQLLDNYDKLHEIQSNAMAIAKLDATENIVKQLKSIIPKS